MAAAFAVSLQSLDLKGGWDLDGSAQMGSTFSAQSSTCFLRSGFPPSR